MDTKRQIGIRRLSSHEEAADVSAELRTFEIFDTGGVQLATRAASTYRTLRGRGRTVRKTIDCLIATFRIEHGHRLLHADADFDAFEELGLVVVRD